MRSNPQKLTDEKWVNLFKRDDGYIVASRNETPDPEKIGVVAAAVFYRNKIVVLKQYRNIIGKNEYDIPAGLVDEGETPAQAIVREVKEETGLNTHLMYATPDVDFMNQVIYSSAGLTDENYKLYWLWADSDQELNPEKGIEVILFDISGETKQLFNDAPITCRALLVMLAGRTTYHK